jgi:hypothetical protein
MGGAISYPPSAISKKGPPSAAERWERIEIQEPLSFLINEASIRFTSETCFCIFACDSKQAHEPFARR